MAAGGEYLAPLIICTIEGFDQLGVVEVDEVWTDAYSRAIFIVELLDAAVVVARPHQK